MPTFLTAARAATRSMLSGLAIAASLVEFFNNRDWPVASATATVMLVVLLIPIMLFHRYQFRELEARD